jgi:hypothetical protein
MKDVNLTYQVLAAGRNSSHRELHRPRQPGPYPSNRPRERLDTARPSSRSRLSGKFPNRNETIIRRASRVGTGKSQKPKQHVPAQGIGTRKAEPPRRRVAAIKNAEDRVEA